MCCVVCWCCVCVVFVLVLVGVVLGWYVVFVLCAVLCVGVKLVLCIRVVC